MDVISENITCTKDMTKSQNMPITVLPGGETGTKEDITRRETEGRNYRTKENLPELKGGVIF